MTQDPVTHPTRSKHHRKPKENRIHRLWREMPELFLLVLAAIGFLMLTAYTRIRYAMIQAANRAANTVIPRAKGLNGRIAAFVKDLSPAEILGFALLLIAVVAIAYRLRWRLMHSQSLTALACPRCGGEIHRIHRHFPDRIANWFVPVRRYRCWKKDCEWSGLRVAGSSKRRSSSERR
jgi:hypothetical protein